MFSRAGVGKVLPGQSTSVIIDRRWKERCSMIYNRYVEGVTAINLGGIFDIVQQYIIYNNFSRLLSGLV